ncbi:ketopantoate reductase family protein [Mangrovitalea sediminis]|uniref:ketopantoate reductase family protein n=1 Tax=Mangrovitalea sediminis TaxID=1982043 RepID=UPI000BE54155|nr:2-dehydropantoate 2-reductase [Mangrovitalea sediminis]
MSPTDTQNDRTLILGAGSLGRLFGGYLASFVPVTVLQRTPATVPTLTYDLIAFDGSRKTLTLPVSVAGSKHSGIRWALVTTKANDVEAAVETLIPTLPMETAILLFQNGMGSQQAIASRHPERPILCASTTEGANRPDQSTLCHAGQGETWIGSLTPSGETACAPFARLLNRAGLKASVSNNIEERLWQKLAINAGINAFTAILGCTNGHILEQPFFAQNIAQLSAEIAAIATASGYPTDAGVLEARIRDVALATRDNVSSMLQDLRSGRPTEIDYINGYLVRQGQRLGLKTPMNQTLVDAVLKAQGSAY